ncbi:hypothetical protein EVAR_57584_1 [Eumeta japonica]|uniref:Uncharacterized protein n=1 Tax=Eumeta variegata TaxID=151549 RepID=A0A4C1Z7N2_EUMVA|nr:hypothetical protein EVAR_57584_1 [Eumeta japonica]
MGHATAEAHRYGDNVRSRRLSVICEARSERFNLNRVENSLVNLSVFMIEPGTFCAVTASTTHRLACPLGKERFAQFDLSQKLMASFFHHQNGPSTFERAIAKAPVTGTNSHVED